LLAVSATCTRRLKSGSPVFAGTNADKSIDAKIAKIVWQLAMVARKSEASSADALDWRCAFPRDAGGLLCLIKKHE
jgi:hypothetical protein